LCNFVYMRAIRFDHPGDPEVLYVGEWETPKPSSHEILVKVKATALNRADTLQRKGKYPVPPGASPILGLEMAGEVLGVGDKVTQWQIGDRVMALLSGGGYAQYVAVDEALAMRVPDTLTFEQAAGIPEVFLTAFQALDWLADLQPGEKVLIHAGASGVGTAAIQLAKKWGAEIFVTASQPKHTLCLSLGADHTIDYRSANFVAVINQQTYGKGVNVIIDFIAAPYFQDNLKALSTDGRLILLALMGGSRLNEVSIADILRKRLQITGSTLRSRTLTYKKHLTQAFWTFAEKYFQSGEIKPVLDSVYDWEQVTKAHLRMEQNLNAGKIILTVDETP